MQNNSINKVDSRIDIIRQACQNIHKAKAQSRLCKQLESFASVIEQCESVSVEAEQDITELEFN